MIDTGLSYALAPTYDIEKIVEALWVQYRVFCRLELYVDHIETFTSAQLQFYYCDIQDKEFNELPNIQLMISNHFFDIPPQAYI